MLFHKTYSLSIPEPCNENWQHMQPLDLGRYCNSCNKIVTDFTNMNEKEIANFFKQRPQKVCGRFTNTQLQKTYTSSVITVLPLYKRVSRYLISLMLSSTAFEKANAQEPVEISVQSDSLIKDSALTLAPLLQPDSLAMLDTCGSSIQSDLPIVDTIQLSWQYPTITAPSTFTIDISSIKMVEMIISGGIYVEPHEPRSPLDLMIDTISRLFRKMRFKKVSNDTSKSEALLTSHLNKPIAPTKLPLKLPAQEAIVSSSLEWKYRNKRGDKKQ